MKAPGLLLAMTVGVLAIPGQRTGAPGTSATVTLAYRAASEDETQAGRLLLAVTSGRTSRAAIWEHECALGSRGDADIPGEGADQYWSFRADLLTPAPARASDAPMVRVRYRLVTSRGPGPEVERLLAPDGRDTLSLEALSARTTCRYDRIYVTVTAR